MAKANLEGVPAEGSRWELDGEVVTVDGFKAKGRGGYVLFSTENTAGYKSKLSEFRSKAKAV